MNDTYFLTDETSLVARALDELHASVGIHGEVLHRADGRADAAVLLHIDGRKIQYDCEVKKKVDRYSLLLDLINRPSSKQKTLLVSSPLSPDMANRCRELGLEFMDTAGNAYIKDGEGIYIFVAGRRGQDVWAAGNNATMTPAALRMMFAFLADPSLLNAPYRDISHRAVVSTGVIGKVFETLEARHLIGTTTGGRRMIRSPELFLNEWASGYASRLRPKLKKYRFATEDLDKFRNRWSPGFRVSAWGGETGAAYLTKHLQPEEATIYIDMEDDPNALRDLVKDFRLRADPAGRIEVVEMFWNSDYFAEWFPTVPPHLIYSDLIATHDSRNIAVAQQIASEVVEHVHNTSR